MTFTVPGNPIPLARPRVVKGHTYTPKRCTDYKRTVADVARMYFMLELTGPVEMRLGFWRDSAQRCDLDNLVKAVQDALNGIAYADDSQVEVLMATKGIDRDKPRTEIQVSPLVPLAIGGPVDEGEPKTVLDVMNENAERCAEEMARGRKALLSVVSPKRREKVLTKRAARNVRDYR